MQRVRHQSFPLIYEPIQALSVLTEVHTLAQVSPHSELFILPRYAIAETDVCPALKREN